MMGVSAYGMLVRANWSWLLALIAACCGLGAVLFDLISGNVGGAFILAGWPAVLLYLCLKPEFKREMGG